MENNEQAIKYFKRMMESDIGGQGYSRFYYYDLAIQALEKQVAKKGIPYNSAKNHKFIECGVCHQNTDLYYQYCPRCGQRLDWTK